jgi:hypothetical protein
MAFKTMRLLYAVQFEIADQADPNRASGTGVLKSVSSWISEWYSVRKSIEISFPETGGTLSPAPSHDVTVTQELSTNSRVIHTGVSWSYPDDNDGNLLWHTRIEIAEFGGMTEFSFQLFLDSIQYLIAPVEFTLRRPRLIGTMLRQFTCSCGDVVLSLEPRELRAETIEDFLKSRLLSVRRRLPIVLVSRTPVSSKWLIDPSDVASSLAGIAETYYLADKWAAFTLTDAIGKLYSCFNGAVRIYWPDFDLAESPYSPVYTPEKLNHLNGPITDILFRQLAAISAFRYVTGPVTTDAREHLQDEKYRHIEELRAAAEDRGDYRELLELSDKENAELHKDNRDLREENASLKSSLELAQENFRAINQSHQEVETRGLEASSEEPETEPRSVEEAVAMAKERYPETLAFQESALESARESPFMQHKKVHQALLAMHEVCLAWRKSRKTKTPMGTFESAFSAKGFVYKPKESITSRGKWSDEYEMPYQGDRVSIEQHIALGKGGPDTCLRIHFHTDEKEEKFIVAHVGRHKTNTRT